uniref:EF-hand domain-containing protein n=2 Tax=Alexandrium monilatum TaxID=311494 RepID=A0A7S4Q4I8_9DINO
MLVVHTSRAELYGRLWCVYEVNESARSDVPPFGAMSMRYMMKTAAGLVLAGDGSFSEEALRVDTRTAQCWSQSDAQMIRAEVERAGGFDKLNNDILAFRSKSFQATVSMFQEFQEWFQAFKDRDADDSLTFIVTAIQKAAQYVGLQCLLPLAEAAGDRRTCAAIAAEAVELSRHFNGSGFQLPPSVPPPPRYDPARVSRMVDPEDKEQVLIELRTIDVKGRFGGMMVGLLEMSAGGTGAAEGHPRTPAEMVKKTFREWDSDGSGTIEKKELVRVLMRLSPSFTEDALNELFMFADKNADGVLDYEEFVDFVMQA